MWTHDAFHGLFWTVGIFNGGVVVTRVRINRAEECAGFCASAKTCSGFARIVECNGLCEVVRWGC